MDFIKRSSLSKTEKHELLVLWNNEYPKNLNYKSIQDFDNYLEKLTDQSHLLMIDQNKLISGWFFSFIRENEKWFAIILDSKFQGRGLGKELLELAKKSEVELNGWVIDQHDYKKVNGEFYKTPLNFYLKNGFKILPGNRLELDKLSAIKINWRSKDQ